MTSNKKDKDRAKKCAIVNFCKVTDTRMRAHTKNTSFVDGNMHRLQMLHFVSQSTAHVDFYHFLGKLFYVAPCDTAKKAEIRQIQSKYDYAKILEYVRANFASFLQFSDCADLLQLVSETEQYNTEKQHILVTYLCKLHKNKPKRFAGFVSLAQEQNTKRYDYIP